VEADSQRVAGDEWVAEAEKTKSVHRNSCCLDPERGDGEEEEGGEPDKGDRGVPGVLEAVLLAGAETPDPVHSSKPRP
jgi:hypothetical protein